MNYELDVHTHTLASGHAYNTIMEMAKGASDMGLKLLGITEHAPMMPGSCQSIYFRNLKVVPRKMFGIDLMLGVELNIMDFEGNIDLGERELSQMDLVIASLHSIVTKPGTMEENTNATIGAIKNPYVDIIGHPDDGLYPLCYERIVEAAKENHVLLELNNNSLNPRGGRKHTRENQIKMLELCKEYGQPVVMNSDAHFVTDVGRHDFTDSVIAETGFPEELIMNISAQEFRKYIDLNRKR